MKIPIRGQGNPERPLKPKETKYKIPLSLEVSGHVFINALTLRDAVTKAWRLNDPELQIIGARIMVDSLFIDEDKAKEMNP